MTSKDVDNYKFLNTIHMNNTKQMPKQQRKFALFSIMQRTLFVIKNWKKYKYWRARANGKKIIDFDRGIGYYLPLGTLGHNPVGEIWKSKMQNGKTGIYELIDYKSCRDPYNMVKHGWYSFIGYVGEKPIQACTFEEFMDLYAAK